MFRFDAITVDSVKKIKSGIKQLLDERYSDVFPPDKKSKILIKPNLNSNMNALTGNTTDLRVVAAVIEYLQDRGYTSITIGEGTNSGYYRSNISVIERLRYDELGLYYGVMVKDFNYSDTAPVHFEKGVEAGVAKECVEADFMINMPKLKTHFEAGMTVCLKNLIGCLVGQENKKKTHGALSDNIVNLNLAVKPDLHIVDGVIAMEGLGPTRGTPRRTGVIFAGDDPYIVDLMCARFASFPYQKIGPIAAAKRRGIVTEEHLKFVKAFPLERIHTFKPPTAGPLATFIHSPKRQKYFLAIRQTPLFNYLCSTEIGGKLLYLTGLRQDVFIRDEMQWEGLSLKKEKCTNCGICAKYCPTEIALPHALNENAGMGNQWQSKCIRCLYCFSVCPNSAIEFHGTKGFMEEQDRQYGQIIKKMVR
ncbi:DUF362 domain-containing protein [Candidatus Magnetominusculus xianensis]|uniref:[Fe-S]-binding protein n=1 Tax=Candidatus Magnetominusculus xianensis TaxID=1748249 RepID=A0ABR5SFW0_9BACT|nr:DUF362 domain-containing protein [Candidatus Magnetominusculus xianensis]KWT78415.1 [Fe-S]-binding protein [Candidatus Magnetominusculus xianensis]MBF0403158.1 DUF362 domain-containing protein [Nitrospirota bacterium]